MQAETWKVYVRWMIRRDMPEVRAIERDSFDSWWKEEDFRTVLTKRNHIGMVAQRGGDIVGFMVYEFCKTQLHIHRLAVCHSARRQGVGTAMIQKLKNRLHTLRRTELTIEVPDSHFDGMMFLRSNRFEPIGIIERFYEEFNHDAYVMRFDLDGMPSRSFLKTPWIGKCTKKARRS